MDNPLKSVKDCEIHAYKTELVKSTLYPGDSKQRYECKRCGKVTYSKTLSVYRGEK